MPFQYISGRTPEIVEQEIAAMVEGMRKKAADTKDITTQQVFEKQHAYTPSDSMEADFHAVNGEFNLWTCIFNWQKGSNIQAKVEGRTRDVTEHMRGDAPGRRK